MLVDSEHRFSNEITADACLTGWGVTVGRGHWAQVELDHINVLILKDILMGLSSLCKDHRNTYIHLRLDNTTTVACLDCSGSTMQ